MKIHDVNNDLRLCCYLCRVSISFFSQQANLFVNFEIFLILVLSLGNFILNVNQNSIEPNSPTSVLVSILTFIKVLFYFGVLFQNFSRAITLLPEINYIVAGKKLHCCIVLLNTIKEFKTNTSACCPYFIQQTPPISCTTADSS